MTAAIPIVVYHSVSDDPSPHLRRWTVSRAEFAAQVDALVACGRVPMTITEVAAGLRGERPLPERAMAVTFDDGFADNYVAIEELLRRDLTATLYITTGLIGADGRLSPRQLAVLAGLPGIEVGAHGVRHERLDELDDDAIEREVTQSKTRVEQVTGVETRSFAYPHGAYDRRARAAVIAAGYSSAAGVKNALSHAGDDPFAIARWLIRAGTAQSRFVEVLDGGGIRFAWSRERLRTRGYRTARRLRRRLSSPGRSRR